MVGSISHTTGLCVAAAAKKVRFRAIGIDCEAVGHISTDLWRWICTTAEIAWLDMLPAAQRAAAATLIFSAKEAFYKLQYPIVGEWLDFGDLQLEIASWGSMGGRFLVHPTRPLAIAKSARFPIEGKGVLRARFVTAGIALDAG
jgi:4'-phosphopantetheinyl transferase EntD